MGWGTGNIGGGSGGLNFKVVAYVSEESLLADTPKENTIGVITTVKITDWVFAAQEPDEPNEGTIWIETGQSSDVEFNALKKNSILVYPVSIKQYISGVWETKSAQSYQNAAWHSWWSGELYVLGNEFEDITGGWGIDGYSYSSGVQLGSKKETFLQVTGGTKMTMFGTRNIINTSAYSKLYADVQVVSSYNGVSGPISLLSSKEYRSANIVAQLALGADTSRRIVSIPLDGIDEAYIVLRAEFATSCVINMYKMWLE